MNLLGLLLFEYFHKNKNCSGFHLLSVKASERGWKVWLRFDKKFLPFSRSRKLWCPQLRDVLFGRAPQSVSLYFKKTIYRTFFMTNEFFYCDLNLHIHTALIFLVIKKITTSYVHIKIYLGCLSSFLLPFHVFPSDIRIKVN